VVDRYQDLARAGDTRPSRFVASASIILYFYFFIGGIIASIPMFHVLITNHDVFKDPIVITDTMGFLRKYISPLPNYIFTNFSIYCMLFGVFIAIKFIHYRPFITLITTKKKIKISKFFIGFIVYGVLVLLGTLVDYLIAPKTYSFTFDASKFWIALPIILIMTPIQTITEELVFRGYVIQSFSLKIKNGFILSFISGVLFALPHLMNPEVLASNKIGVFSTICMILNYFVVGAVFALVTIKTNSLEIAMGAHAVNNLICFIIIGYPDSALPTNTVFLTTNFEPISGLISVIIISILFYFISAALQNSRFASSS
jgi:uncharacterized protein